MPIQLSRAESHPIVPVGGRRPCVPDARPRGHPRTDRGGELVVAAGHPAGPSQPLPELCGQRGIDRQEIGDGRALAQDPHDVPEADELGHRIAVVVHPEVDPAIVTARISAAGPDDEEGRGLAAPPITAGPIARQQRREQAVRQPAAHRVEGLDHRLDDLRSGQDVALDRPAVAGPAACPRQATGSGVVRPDPGHGHDADLPLRGARVGR